MQRKLSEGGPTTIPIIRFEKDPTTKSPTVRFSAQDLKPPKHAVFISPQSRRSSKNSISVKANTMRVTFDANLERSSRNSSSKMLESPGSAIFSQQRKRSSSILVSNQD